MSGPKLIVLDTNFLLIPSQCGVDIFAEIERIIPSAYQLCIVDKTMEELKAIKKREEKKERQAAKIACELVERYNIKIIKTANESNADDAIVEFANPITTIVATQDAALKRRLRQKQVPMLALRQKKYVIMV